MAKETGPFGVLGMPKHSHQPIPRAMLTQLYLHEQQDPRRIAKKLGVSRHKIKNWLNKYNIPTRSYKEANKLVDRTGSNNSFFGKHHTEQSKNKIREHHKELIMQEVPFLKAQGFKVIPVGLRTFKLPDIIAVKDEKIFAVEIDRGNTKFQKNYQGDFDDIIWIVRK